MIQLQLPIGYEHQNGWNATLMRMLVASGLFQVSTATFPVPLGPTIRRNNWSQMRVGDVHVGLDTWDSYAPTRSFLNLGHFTNGGTLANVQVVIKIQYYRCRMWSRFERITGIPVRPWVIMPSAVFPLESFQWKPQGHRYVAVLTGKNNRFGRPVWVNWCASNAGFFTKSDYVSREPIDKYVALLQDSRWGLILKGKTRFHDGKNRRECEFSSCGMPLAMTYQPTYDFPMVAGEHFVLLRKPEDLARLQDIDPRPFAEASRQLYVDHFSPSGMAKSLISLVNSL